jgi:LacI family transcriptional regulator
VLVDNRGGAYTITRHLLEHGRRRIACIAGPDDVMPASGRVAGWRDALAEQGVRRDEMLAWRAPFGRHAGYRSARAILTTGTAGRPDAIFVSSDEQALGVLRAVTELGLRCPEDVALASFDGIPAASYATPALTTMSQPFGDLGRVALAHLLDQIDGRETSAEVMLPVSLVARGSCGCVDPPGGDLATAHA